MYRDVFSDIYLYDLIWTTKFFLKSFEFETFQTDPQTEEREVLRLSWQLDPLWRNL